MKAERAEKGRRASLSGLEVRVLVGELGGLSGGYLSDIHSLGEAQVLRVRKAGGEDSSVIVSPRYGAWITKRPAQTITDEFTTSLRQALLRHRIEAVSQHDLDRVFIFRFARGGGETRAERPVNGEPGAGASGYDGEEQEKEREEVRLILELAPPGNIIVTDRGGRILLSLRELRGPQRTILRGRTYAPPPQTRGSPEGADEASLAAAFASEKTAGRALGRGLSLPRRYVDEILARSSLAQDDPAPLPPEKVAQVALVVRELISSLATPSPSLVRTGDALELMAVAPASGEVVRGAATMSELVDETLGPMLLEDEASVVDDEDGRRSDQATREYEVTLERLERQTADLGARAAALREAALAVRGSASQEEVALALAAPQVGDALRAKVRPGAPPAAVSSMLFDEAKSAEAEVRRIQEVELTLRSRLERSRRVATPRARVKIVARTNREWYEKFRWFFTTEGRLAVGGRDAQSNGILVKKHLTEGDVAYHADLFGSPFFILKGGADQTADEVRQVAKATVTFSSAWKTGLAAADAFWVGPDQVSTTAPSGEFLARGSFVIRGKKNFATKNPVEVSVGVDEKGRVVSGPEEALMRTCRAHVTLIPSREKTSDTAKKVLFELRRLYGEAGAGAELDDVMRALPAGGGKIVRRRENVRSADPGKPPEDSGEATGPSSSL